MTTVSPNERPTHRTARRANLLAGRISLLCKSYERLKNFSNCRIPLASQREHVIVPALMAHQERLDKLRCANLPLGQGER